MATPQCNSESVKAGVEMKTRDRKQKPRSISSVSSSIEWPWDISAMSADDLRLQLQSLPPTHGLSEQSQNSSSGNSATSFFSDTGDDMCL